jgi:hypothetical protein
MLYEYVERKRKENSGAQLHVTYLVSGSLIQNGHSVSSLVTRLHVHEIETLLEITGGRRKSEWYGSFKVPLKESECSEILN